MKKVFALVLSLVVLFILLALPRSGSASQTVYFGKFRGVVVEINDPLNLGRVGVLVPEVYGGSSGAVWALPSFPFAGAHHGLVLIPEVGDNVWVEFEQGDPNSPIWTGAWFTGSLSVENLARKRALFTSQGHEIVVDEEMDEVRLTHFAGPEIVLSEGAIDLQVGRTLFSVTDAGVFVNGKVLVKTKP
jgi:hypothetical protein